MPITCVTGLKPNMPGQPLRQGASPATVPVVGLDKHFRPTGETFTVRREPLPAKYFKRTFLFHTPKKVDCDLQLRGTGLRFGHG